MSSDSNPIMKTHAWLRETFPKCFTKDHALPLKTGILKDIFQHLPEDGSISRLMMRKAIGGYTRHFLYQKAVSKATHRHDLEGNPVEEIQKDHKDHAEHQLAFKRLSSFVKKGNDAKNLNH